MRRLVSVDLVGLVDSLAAAGVVDLVADSTVDGGVGVLHFAAESMVAAAVGLPHLVAVGVVAAVADIAGEYNPAGERNHAEEDNPAEVGNSAAEDMPADLASKTAEFPVVGVLIDAPAAFALNTVVAAGVVALVNVVVALLCHRDVALMLLG